MSARPIGDFIGPIMARCERMASFQALINDCATAADKKEMILTARIGCLIDDEETRLLIQAYGLETA